jgi:hypothetical protein
VRTDPLTAAEAARRGLAQERRTLDVLVEVYLRAVGALDYRRLVRRQPPPFTSVGFGAGGIVYALLHAGTIRGDAALVSAARRWIDEIRAGLRGRGAFFTAHVPPQLVRDSVSDGPPGFDFLDALVAGAVGDRRTRERAMRRFARRARHASSAELLHGRAGFLVAALALERALGAGSAGALADELAATLLDLRWNLPSVAFAHGDAGVAHALFEWAHVRGCALPAELRGVLDRLAVPRMPPPRLHGSWCNGAAGDVLLWSKAYRHYGDPRYLALARTRAVVCGRIGRTQGGLCCGHGGAAYALLALARVSADAAARDRAVGFAMRAVRAFAPRYPSAVLRGYPGLVCLAIDLLAGGGGFPLVEVPAPASLPVPLPPITARRTR